MTVLKFGGKFKKGAYQTSGGLHGVGVTVVNFLSEWCEVEVRRDGHVYQQEYERGVPHGAGQAHRRHDENGHQDDVQARPADLSDDEVFYNILYRRLQELAFLNRGVQIFLNDEQTGEPGRISLRARHSRIRRVPESRQRAAPSRTSSTSPASTTAWASKSPCSTPASTPRTCIRTSTTSTRSKAARTSPASARR